MSDASLYSRNPARFAELTSLTDRLRAEKDAAEERWLMLAEKVEELAG
jgi:ATP-binding cassette subfamily F protein uup